MNSRPLYIWVVIVFLATVTAWLLWGVAAAGLYFSKEGRSLRLMVAYIPALVGACVCAGAGIGILRRKAWVRWLFLLPVALAMLQMVSFVPYLLMAQKSVTDPAARASIRFIAAGIVQPLVFVVVASACAIAVFKYFRRQPDA